MRLGVGVLFCAAGCARVSPGVVVSSPPPAIEAAAPATSLVVFVRDMTEREAMLATALVDTLHRRGLAGAKVIVRSTASLDLGGDEQVARAAGARYAVEIAVVRRSEQRLKVHTPELLAQPAAGVSFGKINEIDVGETIAPEELRIDIVASVLRVGDRRPLERWALAEGSLVELPPTPNAAEASWSAVYAAMASRLVEHLIDRVHSVEKN
jgi:hypothetical protein